MPPPTGLIGAVPGYAQDEQGNWYQIVGSPGPMGPSGPAGATGPTGPLNTNMAMDDLTDVESYYATGGDMLVFDPAVLPSGMWVPTPVPPDEVYVEPTAPATVGSDYIWFDASDTGPYGPGIGMSLDDLLDVDLKAAPPLGGQSLTYDDAATPSPQWTPAGPFLPLTGGTVSGGLTVQGTHYTDGPMVHRDNTHIEIITDGMGVKFNAGGYVYKRTGGGLVIRESSEGAQPQIEDNSGGNPRDIIDTVNGDARYQLKGAGNAGTVNVVPSDCSIHDLADQIVYNDFVVCWNLVVTGFTASEDTWTRLVRSTDYPDFLRPAVTLKKSVVSSWDGGNAGAIGIRTRIDPDGNVYYYKGGSGPDIKSDSLIGLDFSYPVVT